MNNTTHSQSDNELIADRGYKILRNGIILSTRGSRMKTVIKKTGYEQLNVSIDGKTSSFGVHRLVALEYVPNPENKPEVNHLDGDKLNNDWTNLEWCTRSENIKHGIDLGLIPKSMIGRTGRRHWRSIQVEQYDIFGERCGTFESTGDAARQTGFSVKSIQDACKGRIKIYKGFSWKYTR